MRSRFLIPLLVLSFFLGGCPRVTTLGSSSSPTNGDTSTSTTIAQADPAAPEATPVVSKDEDDVHLDPTLHVSGGGNFKGGILLICLVEPLDGDRLQIDCGIATYQSTTFKGWEQHWIPQPVSLWDPENGSETEVEPIVLAPNDGREHDWAFRFEVDASSFKNGTTVKTTSSGLPLVTQIAWPPPGH